MKKKFKYSTLFYFIKYVLFFRLSILLINFLEKKSNSNKLIFTDLIKDISTKQPDLEEIFKYLIHERSN